MIRAVFIAALCWLSTSAAADRVSVLLASRHVGASGFEEINPGLFYTFERPGVDFTFGGYRNSYGRLSLAATAALPVVTWADGEASIFAGVAYYPGDGRRQRFHAGDFVPVAGLQIRQGHAFMQIIPMDGQPVRAVVSFGLTWRIEKRKGF